jgi:hypothetical protein
MDSSKRPRNQLIAGGLMAVISLVVLVFNLRWVSNVLQGPVEIKLADLRRLEDPTKLPNQWVSFMFDKAVETEVAIVRTRGGQSTPRSRFLLIQVQDRWLIADVPFNHAGNQVTGYLETWSVPLRKETIEKITSKFPNYRLLPFQIDAEYSQRGQCFAMLGVVGFFLITGLVLLGMGLVGMKRQARAEAGY